MSHCDVCERDVDTGVACGDCCDDSDALPKLIDEITRLREREAGRTKAMSQARKEAIEECACKLEDRYGNTSIAAFVRDLLTDDQ